MLDLGEVKPLIHVAIIKYSKKGVVELWAGPRLFYLWLMLITCLNTERVYDLANY